MNQEMMREAERLAHRPYTERIQLDETTDGEPIYIAHAPELEGCIAQGRTPEEARVDLLDARVDYIYSLLEDGLPVPDPVALKVVALPPAPAGQPDMVVSVDGYVQ